MATGIINLASGSKSNILKFQRIIKAFIGGVPLVKVVTIFYYQHHLFWAFCVFNLFFVFIDASCIFNNFSLFVVIDASCVINYLLLLVYFVGYCRDLAIATASS